MIVRSTVDMYRANMTVIHSILCIQLTCSLQLLSQTHSQSPLHTNRTFMLTVHALYTIQRLHTIVTISIMISPQSKNVVVIIRGPVQTRYKNAS